MTIYLRSTPSLKKQKKLTKIQQRQLAEYNRQRKELGMPPATTLAAEKPRAVKSTNKIPDYGARLRNDPTRNIPSLSHRVSKDATARNTIMDAALSGKESPEVAAEIIRKGRCLAPAYSKGAVQYISSEEMARDAGRKK